MKRCNHNNTSEGCVVPGRTWRGVACACLAVLSAVSGDRLLAKPPSDTHTHKFLPVARWSNDPTRAVDSTQPPSPQTHQKITVPTEMGRLSHPSLVEVSGMAAALGRDDLFWMVNDSGDAARLYAVTRRGDLINSYDINVTSRDWEELASLEWRGKPYLVIADTGNNQGHWSESVIHLIEEPLDTSGEIRLPNQQPTSGVDNPAVTLTPDYTVHFRFADRPNNVEAMDIHDGVIYLLSKATRQQDQVIPSALYTLDLNTLALDEPHRLHVAERAATLARPAPSLSARLVQSLAGIDVDQPTALDFHPAGKRAQVLTYRRIVEYQRAEDESWVSAFSRAGKVIHTHNLPQAEALTIDSHGTTWFTSEGVAAPLWALPARH